MLMAEKFLQLKLTLGEMTNNGISPVLLFGFRADGILNFGSTSLSMHEALEA